MISISDDPNTLMNRIRKSQQFIIRENISEGLGESGLKNPTNMKLIRYSHGMFWWVAVEPGWSSLCGFEFRDDAGPLVSLSAPTYVTGAPPSLLKSFGENGLHAKGIWKLWFTPEEVQNPTTWHDFGRVCGERLQKKEGKWDLFEGDTLYPKCAWSKGFRAWHVQKFGESHEVTAAVPGESAHA